MRTDRLRMGLTKDQQQKITDVLEHVDKNVGPGEAIALAVKFMALQTRLMNEIQGELDAIGRVLERVAARM
jgi:hypothetical protein